MARTATNHMGAPSANAHTVATAMRINANNLLEMWSPLIRRASSSLSCFGWAGGLGILKDAIIKRKTGVALTTTT